MIPIITTTTTIIIIIIIIIIHLNTYSANTMKYSKALYT